MYDWGHVQIHTLAKEYGWTIEYIDNIPFIDALRLLVIIKKDKAEEILASAQATAVGSNGNEDAWDDFISSLGFTPPKFDTLKQALNNEVSKEDLNKQFEQFKQNIF